MSARGVAGLVVVCALASVSAGAAAQSPPSADVRVRLDVARWPAPRAAYAGVDWAAAANDRGLAIGIADVRPATDGGSLVRLWENGRLRWLVRIAVAADAPAARATFLRWMQPIQGALVRDDAAIAIADVVLLDDRGGHTRAGFVAGNVAIWVAATDLDASGAVELLRALGDRVAPRGPQPPSVRLVDVTQRGADAAERVVSVATPTGALLETFVDGGYVARSTDTTRVIRIADPARGAHLRVLALDALGRVVAGDLDLPARR